MNTQEAYEQMHAHFSQPGAVFGMDPTDEKCMYRTYEGNKCAVGCLLADDEYDHMFDEEPTSPLDLQMVYGLLTDVDESFLTAAQKLHDAESFRGDGSPATFVAKLDKLAVDTYCLKGVS